MMNDFIMKYKNIASQVLFQANLINVFLTKLALKNYDTDASFQFYHL
jgi:hypothetical protein